MKTKFCVGILLLLAAAVAPAETNSLTALLQQGLFEEQANRNLDAAIADYQSLALQFDRDRQLAATAVFRLGECYRAQGRTNEAAAQYQRILHDFADQQTLALLSREDLAGMGYSPSAAEKPAFGAEASKPLPVSAEAGVLATQISGIEKLKSDPEEQARAVLAIFPDDALKKMLLNLPKVQQQEARLKANPELPYGELGGFCIAVNGSDAPLSEGHGTNLVSDAQWELQKQVSWIADRVNFIVGNQKARLKALQMAAGSEATPGAGQSGKTSIVADEEDKEIARIQQMIQNSPDLINAPSGTPGDGSTPLVKAAANGWLKVAAYLLDHGADVNVSPGRGQVTPLLAGVIAGNKAMAQFLIDRGADLNFKGENGDTPLHLAARKGFQAVVEVLLASHADVKSKNNSGMTPLLYAVAGGHVKIIQMLVAAGADPNVKDNEGRTVLNVAIKTSPGIFQPLLAAGTNPNTEDSAGRTPLSYAVEKDSPEVVKLLLAAKADPNLGSLDAPLLCAIQEKNIASAAALLESGAKPDALGKVDWQPHSVNFHFEGGSGRGLATPLWLAVDMDQLPMVQLLLKYKADPNDGLDGQSLLFRALPDTNILAALLEAGGSVEARRTDGWTLLDSAVAQKQFAAVQLLLKHKADPNNSQINGQSILFYTLTETNILEALLDAGANVDPISHDGSHPTPLGAAARDNNAVAVEILLKHGANPNVRNANGVTPLHWASSGPADGKVFELLLAHKADPNARNSDGETPLDLLKKSTRQNNFAPSPGMPPRPGLNHPPPGIPGMAGATSDSKTPPAGVELADLLRQHGALDELPDFTRIRITRQGLAQPVEVFRKTGKLTNQFTLLETVMRLYSLGGVSHPGGWEEVHHALPFPDFGRIIIRRPSQTIGGKEQEIKVNLLNRSNVVDCAHDVPVEFGDVIEIPESVHALNAVTPKPVEELEAAFAPASPAGSFAARLALLQQPGGEEGTARINVYRASTQCLQKSVQLVVAGETTTFKVNSWKEGFLSQALTKTEARSVLRSSSDLSRVTVTRKSGGSGQPAVFTVDVSGDAPNHDDLWLQEGDVITVPDKP